MPTYITSETAGINALFEDCGPVGPTPEHLRRPRRPPRRLQYVVTGAKLKYPWPNMRVGDWVDVPVHLASRSQVTSAASAYTRNHRGFYFSGEAVTKQNVLYTRVWRVRKGEKAS